MENKDIIKKKEAITRTIEAPNIDLNDELTKKIYEVLLATGAVQPAGTVVTLGATTMTEHIGLNQWEPEDVPIRMDFNDDNLKIDTAFFELNENLSQRIDELNTDLSNIIESGSNTNGHWIKYSDGTMVQYHRLSSAVTVDGIYGALFQSANIVWTYPIPFVSRPVLQAGGGVEGAPTYVSVFTAPSIISVTLRIIDAVRRDNAITGNIEVLAIGRWK